MRKRFIREKYTCIIPFYNEDFDNVVKTVREVNKVKEIDLIIVIDDGSSSIGCCEILRTIFINRPKILIKRLNTNFGKTFAIYHALNFVKDGNVLLCDSDLKGLDSEEIGNAIVRYDMLRLDMLILRRLNIGFFPKLIRADTLLSGERILRKTDLANIISYGVKGYELEVAINQFFLSKKSTKCYWSPSSAVNNYKYKKFKFLKGIAKDLKMYYGLVKYIGFSNFIKQIRTFCKEDV
jgi:glycosyltransferase involved in cell wall biosynthesis